MVQRAPASADFPQICVAPIPLGGYVRMLGEHELADRVGEVTEAERSQAHGSKTVGQRMLIAVAGPLANFVLCIALLWLMFVVGRPDYSPTLGQGGGVAAQAGLRPGDPLVSAGRDRLTQARYGPTGGASCPSPVWPRANTATTGGSGTARWTRRDGGTRGSRRWTGRRTLGTTPRSRSTLRRTFARTCSVRAGQAVSTSTRRVRPFD